MCDWTKFEERTKWNTNYVVTTASTDQQLIGGGFRRSQGIQAVPHTFNYKYTVQEKGDLEIELIYKCKVFKTLLEIDNLLVEFKILLDWKLEPEINQEKKGSKRII